MTNPWTVLALLTAGQTAMSMGSYLWGPIGPFLVAEFDLTRAQVGGLTSAFYLVASSLAIPAGVVVDRFGTRGALIYCQVALAVPLLIFGFAWSFPMLIACAALAGTGNGIVNQAGARGVLNWFSSAHRGTAVGIRQTGNMLGGAIAAALLPAIAAAFGWRASIWFVAVVALGFAWLTAATYSDSPAQADKPAAQGPRPAVKHIVGRLLGNPTFLLLLFIAPLMGYGQICMTTFFPLYLTDELAISSQLAGLSLSGAMAAAAVGRIFWGYIGDRYFRANRAVCLVLVLAITALAGAGIANLQPGVSHTWVIALAMLFGLTAMGWHALLLVVVADTVGEQVTGTAFGMLINAAWLGWILGPLAFGRIADIAGYGAAWWTVSGSAVLSALGFGWMALRSRALRLGS